MIFKGKIVSKEIILSSKGKDRLAMPDYGIFKFTDKFVLLPKLDKEKLDALNSINIRSYQSYTLKKLNKYERSYTKFSKFQVTFPGDSIYNLSLTFREGIKLRIVHKKYWLQKNADWFLKTILSLLIGGIIATFFSERGYKRGYQEGLKYKQEILRDTTQK